MKKTVFIVAVLIIIGIAGVAVYFYMFTGTTGGYVFELHEPNLESRFGFLGGGSGMEPSEVAEMKAAGAEWVRPHPGPFIWGDMQDSADEGVSFKQTDKMVRAAGAEGVSVLVTLWPYAEWDQLARPDATVCDVGDSEFSREFGNFRCAPHDWEAYEAWVTAVVERYDGDGVDDMPGLGVKIKHWEAMNEPDLNFRLEPQPEPEEELGLNFFVGEPAEYAELLKRTYAGVKAADLEAEVLIAGAAGGSPDSTAFYREVFSDAVALESFDIANVHCISSDDIATFNVAPYKKLLDEFGITKPIWVTEAEAFISDDAQLVATQVQESTQMALELGAERIFYTSRDFEHRPGGGGDKEPDPKDFKMPEAPGLVTEADTSLPAEDDPLGTFTIIFSRNIIN